MTRILSRLAGILCLFSLLAACTGSDSSFGLGKRQETSNAGTDAQFPDLGGATAPGAASTPGQTPGAPANVSVYFAPIVGAPAELVGVLSQRLAPVGAANGVRLVPAGTPGMTNEIKGYFSAFTENGATSVIHVWDVVSPSGQRVHRIQGQETVAGATADPWSSVTPETMQAIADKVMSQYIIWLRSSALANAQSPS